VSREVSNTILHSVTLRGKPCSAVFGFWQEGLAAFSLNCQFFFDLLYFKRNMLLRRKMLSQFFVFRGAVVKVSIFLE
jgi:hypothetical protein